MNDYGSMVRDLRDGKLRDVKIKGQTYRAVSVERKRKENISLLLTIDQVHCLIDVSKLLCRMEILMNLITNLTSRSIHISPTW